MLRAALFFLIAAGLMIGGCTTNSGTAAKNPALNTSSADCTGHFQFDTAQYGTGQSECRKGRGVAFSAKTEDKLAAGLACDYALTYTGEHKGTGEVACGDGSTGTLEFQETSNHREGQVSVKLKDGRAFQFTYYTSA